MEIQSDINKLELFSPDFPSSLTLRISKFENSTDFLKFVKSCEKLVRVSPEYKEWREYITDVVQDNYCFITHEVMQQVSIDIHHHIPCLFSIVKAVVNKKLDTKESFCSFDICLDVMKVHFENKVGYIPLLKSMHEKYHNGFLQIPIQLVKGDYNSFLKDYGDYLDDEDWCTINERMIVKNVPQDWQSESYPGLVKEMSR